MRLVLGVARRHARLRMSRPRGAGRGARGRHGRRARRRRRSASRSGGVRRDGCGAVRLLHAGPRRGGDGSAAPEPGPERRRDPRGAVRQPVPLYGIHEDPRCSATGSGTRVSRVLPETDVQLGWIGESARRVDGIPKTTGEFEYASDLQVAGMLWGHTLRSPHAYARVRAIDLSGALSVAGVHAVLTHSDVPGRKTYGLEFRDQPVLAIDRVRYFGEAVALVAAEHPEQARRAAERIVVDYEPLAPVGDPERATESEPLHPDRETHSIDHYLHDPRPNVVRTMRIVHGDPSARGEVVVEGTYELGAKDQAFLGPESGLAVPDGEGGVDIYVATQWLHVDREQIAPCLGLPEEQVRMHLSGVGGAFGGREDLSIQIHAALLALQANRPVKMVYNRQESFTGHVHRHPARIHAEHRATRDGRLVCVRMGILLDGGAYASSSTAVTANATSFACGPYEVPNALIETTSVFTNNP